MSTQVQVTVHMGPRHLCQNCRKRWADFMVSRETPHHGKFTRYACKGECLANSKRELSN